jgi:hypothetical protein
LLVSRLTDEVVVSNSASHDRPQHVGDRPLNCYMSGRRASARRSGSVMRWPDGTSMSSA